MAAGDGRGLSGAGAGHTNGHSCNTAATAAAQPVIYIVFTSPACVCMLEGWFVITLYVHVLCFSGLYVITRDPPPGAAGGPRPPARNRPCPAGPSSVSASACYFKPPPPLRRRRVLIGFVLLFGCRLNTPVEWTEMRAPTNI